MEAGTKEKQRERTSPLARISAHPKITFGVVSAIFGFLVIALFFPPLSPFYPAYSVNWTSADCNYFYFVGKEMLAGKKPYIDIYDQKGVFTFLLFAFIMACGGVPMAGILHMAMVGAFGYFLCLSVYTLTKKMSNALVTLSLAFGFLYYSGQGSPVGIEVLWISSIAYYLYIKAMAEDKAKLFLIGSFVAGLEIGIAFGMRPTDGVVCFSLFLFYFIYFLLRKTKLHLLWNAFAALGGFGVPVVLILAVSISGGYFQQMIQVEYIDGLSYHVGTNVFHSYVIHIYLVLGFTLAFALFAGIRLIIHQKNRTYGAFVIINVAVSVIANLLMARFTHYLISIAFSMLLPWFFYFPFFPIRIKRLSLKSVSASALASTMVVIGVAYSIFYYGSEEATYSKYANDQLKEEIVLHIPNVKNLKEDELFVMDVNAAVLHWLDYKSSCPNQAYTSWHALSRPELCERYIAFMEEKKPTYIICIDKEAPEYYAMPHRLYVLDHYDLINEPKTTLSGIEIFRIRA